MERLTTEFQGYNQLCECLDISCSVICKDNTCHFGCPIQKAFDKLAHYETLEEQGLILKLPIAIGEPCYILEECRCYRNLKKEINGCKTKTRMNNGTGAIAIKYLFSDSNHNFCEKIYERPFKLTYLGQIGKTVFLTKEEAEEALRKKVE